MESSSQRGRERWSEVRFDIPSTDRLLDSQPGRLRGSRFNTPEDLEAFAQRFDDGVKRLFSNDQVPQYVKFGSPRDNDPKCGIKAGRLTLTG